ncbi:pentatricopeptide repeat-containing protein [Dorcoceras hygrometricum]|uniref:Pentatricopeptide repeat-containing protein n=1 Tax=Dorcoceras hygrometricum TaxID=472368 RepID=A0A2Z7CQX8_9LAMI|nr:pentatricopeptide repeat-containing protein [Dorcoceras hygrometricum]
MAASLIHNAIQIYFNSVFSTADEGMVQMFKALESSGLRGFLGCYSAIYEAALVDFFHNASLKTSCKKREMKFEFRLLNDILEKTITVKARSFDAVTHERFLMMAVSHGRVKINWGRLLFNILNDMVTAASKQARGFAVQICIILKGVPDMELGESKAFPPLKILTAKIVGTYVAKKENISVEEVVDEPVEKVVKKAVTKRRHAPTADEPIAKKKITTLGRAAPAKKNLAIVPVVQNPEPISIVPAVIAETAEIEEMETDLEEPVVMETAGTDPVDMESRIEVSAITNEEEPLVEKAKEKEEEKEK